MKFRMSIGLSYRTWKKTRDFSGVETSEHAITVWCSNQLICEASSQFTRRREVTHSNPVEVLKFFQASFCNGILQWHSAISIPQSINAIYFSYMISLDDRVRQRFCSVSKISRHQLVGLVEFSLFEWKKPFLVALDGQLFQLAPNVVEMVHAWPRSMGSLLLLNWARNIVFSNVWKRLEKCFILKVQRFQPKWMELLTHEQSKRDNGSGLRTKGYRISVET